MKKIKVLAVAVMAVALQAQAASASIILEPYLGYGTGSYKQEVTTGDVKADLSGVLYGARVGYGFGPLTAALDVTMGTVKGKPEGGGASSDADTSAMGITAMFAPPLVPVRAWVGYAFKNESKDDTSKSEGNAIKIGGGFSPIPLVPFSVNVEYVMNTFDKGTTNGVTTSLPTTVAGVTVKEGKSNVILISVSAPLSF